MPESVIWKYRLDRDVPGSQVIEMPDFSVALTAQIQDDRICLWAFVDPSKPPRQRKFEVIATGQTVNGWIGNGNHRTYIATVQQGPYVWHVFEND